jgi:hypothetical protein
VIKFNERDDLLKALHQPKKVEELDNNITAITISSKLVKPFEYTVAPFTLYQRHWYEDLLASINGRTVDGLVLIGSAGTSKSTWQYWYLYRVLQAIHHSKCIYDTSPYMEC